MDTTNPVKVSKNCWKHTSYFGSVFYRRTSDPYSDLHRTDGPAFEGSNGTKKWYVNNVLHRTDGPAVEYKDGTKFWYYLGMLICVKSQKEFNSFLKDFL